MLLNLPPETYPTLSLFLSPRDILSFLSVHRNINHYLSDSPSFWKCLLDRDCETDPAATNDENNNTQISHLRKQFLLQSHKSTLTSVHWIPLQIERIFPITPREGHLSCVLKGIRTYKSLVVTGGFADDHCVAVVRVAGGVDSHLHSWGWDKMYPEQRASLVYGATLTALPTVETGDFLNVAKAVRFGGFRGGGYTGETNEVWVLTIRDEFVDGMGKYSANWEKIKTHGVPAMAIAYHTATLLHERYLFIVGGMTPDGCVMEEALLDTHTWTWIDISLATIGEPMPRHGHSVVWDERRDRLVMFGGGNGTDLLRSGEDTNEVWELNMRGVQVPENLDHFKYWEWRCVHDGVIRKKYNAELYCSSKGEESGDEMEEDEMDICLTPKESLCLGRCHNGMKIAPDTVLLMFGGGRVNTNGVLGYNLRTDTYIRPKVSGVLPMPRFTGVASYLESEGYVFVHGGYNTVESEPIQDITLLDVAPLINRYFDSVPVDRYRSSHEEIVHEDARSVLMETEQFPHRYAQTVDPLQL